MFSFENESLSMPKIEQTIYTMQRSFFFNSFNCRNTFVQIKLYDL